jgi:hypothetical protein
VCGGLAYQDVRELLGHDVGVAVTGDEAIPTTLLVTEGFGDLAMASGTFELLASLEGRHASVNGATQIRAGVIRPELIVPEAADTAVEIGTGAAAGATADDATAASASVPAGLALGATVRCIRAPYFGRIGTVAALPVELHQLPSETRVRVLEVDLRGERVIVPRANVEVIDR